MHRYNPALPVGGIAQLGERLHGMQEVSGSIPLTSTNKQELRTGAPHQLPNKKPDCLKLPPLRALR